MGDVAKAVEKGVNDIGKGIERGVQMTGELAEFGTSGWIVDLDKNLLNGNLSKATFGLTDDFHNANPFTAGNEVGAGEDIGDNVRSAARLGATAGSYATGGAPLALGSTMQTQNWRNEVSAGEVIQQGIQMGGAYANTQGVDKKLIDLGSNFANKLVSPAPTQTGQASFTPSTQFYAPSSSTSESFGLENEETMILISIGVIVLLTTALIFKRRK